jgi:hypothetical protein
VAGLETAPPACPVWQWFEISRPIFKGTLCGQIRDSRLPSNCHQRSQIQANASKRTQQTGAAIPLISLGKVRERFAALGTASITNRRPASLNKRLSNLFNNLTGRHYQSLPAISHRLARVWRKGFLAVLLALMCVAAPTTAQQAVKLDFVEVLCLCNLEPGARIELATSSLRMTRSTS